MSRWAACRQRSSGHRFSISTREVFCLDVDGIRRSPKRIIWLDLSSAGDGVDVPTAGFYYIATFGTDVLWMIAKRPDKIFTVNLGQLNPHPLSLHILERWVMRLEPDFNNVARREIGG